MCCWLFPSDGCEILCTFWKKKGQREAWISVPCGPWGWDVLCWEVRDFPSKRLGSHCHHKTCTMAFCPPDTCQDWSSVDPTLIYTERTLLKRDRQILLPLFLWLTCSVVSDSLRPHKLQHAGFPCPSPPPRGCPSSLSWWCYTTVSFSVFPFSSCLLPFPASGSFPVSRLFTSGGWSIGVSASNSVLPMNIQDLISLRMDWFDLLAVQEFSSLL